MSDKRTAAENFELGHRPPFCEVHWSWLCGQGRGGCALDRREERRELAKSLREYADGFGESGNLALANACTIVADGIDAILDQP